MDRTNENLLKKAFNSYLLVSILVFIAGTLGMLVDGIVIGQVLGQSSVSAFGLAGPVFIMIAAVAGIFSSGSSAAISNYIGRGDSAGIRRNFTVTMVGTIVIGAVMTAVCVIARNPIAALLGAKGELVGLTADYILGVGIGVIPTMIAQVMMYYVRLDNNAKISFVSVLGMTTVNIALDLIFANVFHLGLLGMGLATSISYVVCMLICFTHFLRKDNIFRLAPVKNGMKEFTAMFAMGVPSALNRGCMTLRSIILNWLLMSLAGSVAVSALAVQNNVNQILTSVTMGVGMTTMTMAGIFFGERNEKSLEKTLKISLRTGMTLSGIVCVLVFIFAKPVVHLFLNADQEAVSMAVRSLRFFCLSLPLSLACVVFINFYQCTKNLFMANMVCILHGFLYVVLVSLLFGRVIGTDSVWISFLCSEILTLLSLVLVVKKKLGRWPRRIEDMALIPSGFVPEPEKVLDLSIGDDMGQVMELSRRVSEFCGKYTRNKEKIARLSLCIEEIAGNIIQHGFKKGKNHFIDIRIIIDGDNIIFRIRDNGAAFNPIKYADETPEHGTDNLGLQIVRKIAKEMDYSYAVNMNNLTIVL